MYISTKTSQLLLEQYKRYFEFMGYQRVHEPIWPSAIFYENNQSRYLLDISQSEHDKYSVLIDYVFKGLARHEHPLKDN